MFPSSTSRVPKKLISTIRTLTGLPVVKGSLKGPILPLSLAQIHFIHLSGIPRGCCSWLVLRFLNLKLLGPSSPLPPVAAPNLQRKGLEWPGSQALASGVWSWPCCSWPLAKTFGLLHFSVACEMGWLSHSLLPSLRLTRVNEWTCFRSSEFWVNIK